MADPRAFISFDFDNDRDRKMLFAGQTKNSRVPFSIQDWSCKAELPQREWEERINNKICKCDMLIVLVGKKTYSATGVIKEIRFAREHSIPVFGVYVNGANEFTTLPEGLRRNRTVKWEWEEISDQVDWAVEEGKR